MDDKEVVCSECETEYTITHEEINDPEFCAFCGCKINEDAAEWDDEFYEGLDDE